ncbi:MAG: signal peptidase I [Deltaproteobacteria bacterium]|nr:signal peptidase I [Deltaproteobacteria bacterium]
MPRRSIFERLAARLRRTSSTEPRRPTGWKHQARSLGGVLLVCLLFRAFIAEAHVIPSGSMIPTLEVGDRLYVNKLVYGLNVPFLDYKLVDGRAPRRGEVITFSHPREPGKILIKRVVAVSGDTVELRAQVLVVNGRSVPRRRLAEPCPPSVDSARAGTCAVYLEELGRERYRVLEQEPDNPNADLPPRRVPEGHLFVLGDNRDDSDDSRFWGTVPQANVKGRAFVIFWSSGGGQGVRWRRFFTTVH